MALATQCPHCGKRFRVAADQLKLRGGIVRCGACHEIFDGNATLIDLSALAATRQAATQAAPPPATNLETVVPAQSSAPPPGIHTDSDQPEASPQSAAPSFDTPDLESPATDTANEPASADDEPIYTLDFDHTFDPYGILPKPAADDDIEPAPVADTAAAASEPVPDPEPSAPMQPEAEPPAPPAPPEPAPTYADTRRIEPALGLPVDEELVAAALPGHDDFGRHEPTIDPGAYAAGAPLPMRASAPAEPLPNPRPSVRLRPAEARAARRSKLTPTKISAPKLRVPEIDEPEFVKRGRQQEQSGKTRRLLLSVGTLVLLLALAAQSVLTFRNVLAARYPGARPALVSACALLRCRVELPAQIDNLAIEQGELAALGANTYSLATLLHNQGNLVQAWPHIELALLDPNDKPLVRRVFTPAEYLPQGVAPAAGFASRAEQPVKLYFQLDQLKPSGYRIAIFYP